MDPEKMKVLQLGKFYPIRGGVEKVAFDLMKGLSENTFLVICSVRRKRGVTG